MSDDSLMKAVASVAKRKCEEDFAYFKAWLAENPDYTPAPRPASCEKLEWVASEDYRS
jgi:hypothetical protein